MLEKLEESSGAVVGYKAIGKITVEDYEKLGPEVEALVEQHPDGIYMLLDLEDFKSELPKAWPSDFKFGHRFHDKVKKMAIVGDKRWEKWMTELVHPFYAKEGKYFHTDEIDEAWAWLREG